MSEPHRSETLPRSARMRAQRDFTRVFRYRLRASDRWITLYAAPNGADLARLGISASRRLGGAVKRNRLKRRVREAFRRIRQELPSGTDWVVVPRPGPEPSVTQLQASIRSLARDLQAHLP